MKKILLLSALAVTVMVNARVQENSQQVDLSQVEKVQLSSQDRFIEGGGSFNWQDMTTIMNEHRRVLAAKTAEYDGADIYYAPGAFHLGIYEGLGAYNLAMILFPYLDSVVYYNYYGATDWVVNGKTYAENTDEFVTGYGIDGLYYVPETSDHTLQGKTQTYSIKGTKYGNGAGGQYVCSAIHSKLLASGTDNAYMTLCGMEIDTLYDKTDFWMVGGSLTGDPYHNGTGVHLDSANREVTADTLGVIVDNRGTMKIEQILIPIYTKNSLDVNAVIPADAEIRLAIFPVHGNLIDLEDTIASTVLTQADFVNTGVTWGTIGTLHAKFYDEDLFGELIQTPIWITGDFYLQLTNFNESGCDFGIYEDYFNVYTGTTVYQHDGKFSFRAGYGWGDEYGQNLGISFDAYWPTLANDTTCNEMNAPIAGGYAHFGDEEDNYVVWLLSNVNYEEWNVETEDEWLSAAIASTDYWEQYSAIALVIEAEELPEGISGRRGTITFEADGATQVFTITQGEAPEGIEETRVDLRSNDKTYNVLGQEVGEDYKGIVIKNGKKYIR